MTTTQRSFGFVRVSTGSQDAQTQERDIKSSYPDAVIVRPDTAAASASRGEQLDALDAVIAKLRPGDKIVVTDSSRLDRRENLWDQLSTIMAIRATGATVVSLDPEEDDFAVDPQATIERQRYNAKKSATVKKQTWRGVQSIIANKAWCGNLPPLWTAVGERYNKQAVCTDPDAVRAIYRGIVNGESMSSLARTYGTYPQSVRTLVRTEANKTGVFQCHYTYAGETYRWEHTADPVVDPELWHAAKRVLDDIQEHGRTNLGGRPVTEARSWISGIIPCPNCEGHLYVSRGKSLRCGGKGKDRRSCGVSGIPLDRVTEQIDDTISDENTEIYRFQRVSGNQAELDELKSELDRTRQTLATTDDDEEFDRLSVRRKELRESIGSFQLVRDSYEMSPTGETLADLWRTGDKRVILKALQKYLGINVGYGVGKPYHGMVWIESFYPSDVLIEITPDLCIRADSIRARVANLEDILQGLESIENDRK